MTTRTLTVTLQIELADLSEEERAQHAKDCDCQADELPDVNDIDEFDLGEMVANHLEWDDGEIWAGSNQYAKIQSVRAVAPAAA